MSPPALLLATAEALVNRFLAQDLHSIERLQQLGGSLSLRHRQLGWEVELYPARHGITLGEPEGDSRAQIELDTRAILRLLREPGAGRAVPGMTISGDAEYLQQLAEIFQGVESDLGALLEPWLGDQAGIAAAGLQRAFGWLREGWRDFEAQSADYLSSESGELIKRVELEAWMNEVDDLGMAVDRAEARLQRLETRGLTP